MEPNKDTPSAPKWSEADKWLISGLVALLMARLITLFVTPLSLGVDEAQYWIWSQNPDFGYYSKPPLIAWLIGVSHTIFGHSSWAVRLPAPLLQFGIALILWRIGAMLYGARAGQIAGLLWGVMPAAGLGSLVISTDSPLLFFWSLGLYFFIKSLTATQASDTKYARRYLFAAGLAAGCAMLGKYAALYFILSATLYLSFTMKRWALLHIGIFWLGFILAASPNLLWNLSNGFVTFQHLGENANLAAPNYSFAQLGAFAFSQFGVFGPLSLGLAIFAAVSQTRHRTLLLSFSVPVLLIMMGQAFLKEANANWAVTAYPSLTLLLAGWLSQTPHLRSWRARGGLLAISINGGLVFILSYSVAVGDFGKLTPKSDPLRRLRGWEVLATDMIPHLDKYQIKTILADSRAAAAILPFHLYPRHIDVQLFDHDGHPTNHFERAYNFTPDSRLPALAIVAPEARPVPDFVNWSGPVGSSDVSISTRRNRQKIFFISQ